jgi:acyl-coenzyme A synthetase/AMP-(fatty) acid ligase
MRTASANTAPATVGELLELRRTAPDEEFLITDAERLTFGEADSRSAELAGALHGFVLGLPHPVRGQVVGAVIVPRHGTELTAADITGYARAKLSSYKVPTIIRLLAEDKQPMLPTGKADREALTRLLADG